MLTTTSLVVISASSIVALIVLSGVWAWTFKNWVELKRTEMGHGALPAAGPAVGNRIELADLKERVKKLEAIAAGVDL
jgi:hypothetical protein